MGVKVEGLDGLMSYIQRRADAISKAFVDDLNYLGLKAVAYIRNRSADQSWVDRTGNLRSSIGYIVVSDGKILNEGGFESVSGPQRGDAKSDGSQEGRTYAESLASRYSTGYALIVVAGMNYAAYVEAMENKDVLASGEIFLKKELKGLVEAYNAQYR